MDQPKKTALIVDDERSVRFALSMQLERLGYDCTEASGGEEALEKLANQDFDLMMSDMRMPGMSGLQVVLLFRQDHPKTCIVALSAVGDASIAAEAIRVGADDYIIKPCHPHDLSARLRRADKRREVAQQGAIPGEMPLIQVDLDEIARDLASQQEALYERSNSSLKGGG